MNDTDTRRLESFLRGQEFGRIQSVIIATNAYAAELMATLTNIINQLQAQAAAQSSGLRAAQQSASSKASARDELLLDLKAIARTARGMALTDPGIEDLFRVRHNAKDQDLLNMARAILADATPRAAEFIRRGMPADFLEDLAADIKRFEQAIARHTEGTGSHVAATAAIDDLMDEGIKTMQELDPVMRNLFADDPAALAQWFSASRVERAPRKAAKQPPPPPKQ